ncbi:PREDICTED: vitronectin [Elephantulus edwardii]|uniref:vitronectin n=1 Tax=Elephantulus edwardii TaxID=28737 RepID=UPI0003F069A5|nr:PREDICTED: vitronectin [Elephantulus edwardii]
MASPRPLLMLALLAWAVLADQESCKGRCTEGFNADRKCQCDELCSYYQSCCMDYVAECRPQVTRGDVFTMPEDEYGILDYPEETRENTSTHIQPEDPTQGPSLNRNEELNPVRTPEEKDPKPERVTLGPEVITQGVDTSDSRFTQTPAEDLCGGAPFDAFTDLKNGSLFAFRGLYCYELDHTAVKPGYPKLIRDVWGIEGPIDAAFTRINCQGKTYLFKGSQYWRFEDGVLDPDYPRNISDGFSGIPDNLDAAVALPAHSYNGRERVYFFKGKQYWQYEFHNQPTREECEYSSMSTVFEHFALMQRSSWENIFEFLFWGGLSGGASEPMLISQGWPGVPGQVDAAMAGHIYISGSAPASSWTPKRKTARRNRKRYRSRSRNGRGRSQKSRRTSRALLLSLFSSEESGLGTYNDYDLDWLVPASCEPIQSVYFFSGAKYYRVNLRTRQVDTVSPPYPRSIAQYWLGCPVRGRR